MLLWSIFTFFVPGLCKDIIVSVHIHKLFREEHEKLILGYLSVHYWRWASIHIHRCTEQTPQPNCKTPIWRELIEIYSLGVGSWLIVCWLFLPWLYTGIQLALVAVSILSNALLDISLSHAKLSASHIQVLKKTLKIMSHCKILHEASH